MRVTYMNVPSFSFDNYTKICPGNSVTITPPVNNVTYLWNDGSTKPFFTITEPGNYWLKASNFCGSSTAAIQIDKGTCQLLLPDAFTPNGDGLNDIFRVKYGDFIKTFQLSVYSRWGQKIFEITDPKTGWNGTYNNIPQPLGTYAWVIALKNLEGKFETSKGTVLLIR